MEEIPKISGVLRGNCCENFRNISHKKTYEEVYQDEFFNKRDSFSEFAATSYK